MDLALNNLQRVICHKTQQTKPNQTLIYNGVDTVYTALGDSHYLIYAII